ncbi:hypothetical protein B7486_13370 [cyanobacterium TDX16]|nr:hypothetical protein B7486_13370 [cyanobacterium TDX16]
MGFGELFMTERVQDLIKQCGSKGVCPQPDKWAELHRLLCEKADRIGVREPSLPLILGAWHFTGILQKQFRLHEHISWADEHGVLDEAERFLMGLSDDEWYPSCEE